MSYRPVRPTVLVLSENPNLDYTSAEQFGDIKFVTAKDFSNVKNSIHNRDLTNEIVRAIASFDPNNDYIITTGSPVVNAAAFMALGLRNVAKVNVLRWSNQNKSYSTVKLDLVATPLVGSGAIDGCNLQ